jgi:hypothetical protein
MATVSQAGTLLGNSRKRELISKYREFCEELLMEKIFGRQRLELYARRWEAALARPAGPVCIAVLFSSTGIGSVAATFRRPGRAEWCA